MSRFFKRKSEEDEPEKPFQATMPIDTEEIKIVEARLNGETCFWGVGTARTTKKDVAGSASVSQMGGSGEYSVQREYEWKYYVNPNNMPGFIPADQLPTMLSGTVSAVSSTQAIPSNPTPLKSTIDVGKVENASYKLSPQTGLETVYVISGREAKSLLELIKLWIKEQTPQHYTKWCQMHQIVATNLYYMGLVKRTASMSGFYYPTEEALKFFEGKKNIPKKRVFVRDKEGKRVLANDEGESRSFVDYLSDYADGKTALREYEEALLSYRDFLRDRKQSTSPR